MEKRLTEDWADIQDVVIYGFGRVAKDTIHYFKRNFNVKYIVDGSIENKGRIYQDIPVYHIDEKKTELKKYKIIITTAQRNAKSIGQVLTGLGLIQYQDYCSLEEFASEWFWRFQKKICLMEVHTSITTRCTLKCEHCNMFMPYYKNHVDYSYEDIQQDVDLLLKNVDYIFSLKILGGEPLLNNDLWKMIQYIGEKYIEKVGNIGVITNGTILPEQKLIDISKKYHVRYFISDYTNVVPYDNKLREFVELMQKNQIEYTRGQSLRWCDFGFPKYSYPVKQKDIREHMLECGPIFHGLNDRKFYYCHVAWSAERCGLCQLKKSDYIELDTVDSNSIEERERIIEHSVGNVGSEGGYVSLCAICGGCGNDNTTYVKAAEQMR